MTPRLSTDRRVRVTAVCFRTALQPGPLGRRKVDSELAAPAESRTPTGTGAWRSTGECEWKQGDRDGRRYRRGGDEVHPHNQDIRRPRLPFPPARFCASRPPVQAPLRIASLGLDGTWPAMPEEFPEKREWQALAGRFILPPVGRHRAKEVNKNR
jgi:hypothetical protein